VFSELEAPEASRALAPGDSLVLYTDGLLEPDLDERQLLDLLASCAGLDAEDIATRLEDAVSARRTEQRDDVALLVVRVTDS
jgi:serine phosphatase RsbU (regulator of sigma subunit)